MARIPQYQSRIDPRVGAEVNLPRANADMFGAGLGESLQRAGGQMAVRQERQRREAEEAAENAQLTEAARAFEEANAAIAKERLTRRESAPETGEGHAEGVLASFDAQRAAALERVTSPKAKDWLDRQFIRVRGDIDVQESGFAAGLRASKVVGDYSASRDLAANALFTMPERKGLDTTIAAHDELVDGLRLPADAKAKLKAENRNAFAEQYARGLSELDPYALRAEIDKGDLNALLQPDALAALRNRADSEIRGREAQARMERNQRRAEQRAAEAEAKRAQRDEAQAIEGRIRDYADFVAAGGQADPAEIAEVAGAAARLGNAGLARRVAILGEKAGTTIALRGATPRQTQDAINGLTAEIAKGGRNVVGLKARLDAALDFKGAQDRGLNTDPLSYATTQGIVALAPLDPADRTSVRSRLEAARVTRSRYGGPLAVLTDEETAEYGARLRSGDANQRLTALNELRALGSEGSAAALRQIGKNNPVMARTGALLATGGGIQAARTILDGSDALRNKQVVAPQTDAYPIVRETVGRSLRFLPELESQIPETARAFYAGFKAQNGEADWSPDQMGQSTNTVLGAVRGRDGQVRGGLGERRGATVLLPDGKTDAEFNAMMDRLTVANTPEPLQPVWSNGKPVTDAQLRNARPFAIGGGRYVLATDRAGENIIMRRNGRPFEVLVR
jgi:hypothetical protein